MLRSMLSLEPLTVGKKYPELFQTGETIGGRPIIDAQHPHDFFMEIAAESGVPVALRDHGIDYRTLAASQPGLVWCSISGFGDGSPYAAQAAHDITLLGYSGLLGLMAGDTVPPTPDFVLAVPFGALVAVIGILAAITERDRSGEGRFVDTSIVVLGPPIGTDTTGQSPEGTPCV